MTPEEALSEFAKRASTLRKWGDLELLALEVLEACVATAKIDAKKTETRRCAAMVEDCGDTNTDYSWIAGKLLRTGGLEAEGGRMSLAKRTSQRNGK